MHIAGRWRLIFGANLVGPELNRTMAPLMVIGEDGKLAYPEGRGALELEGDRHFRVNVSASTLDTHYGTLFSSAEPLPADLDPDALPAGVKAQDIELVRDEHLDAWQAARDETSTQREIHEASLPLVDVSKVLGRWYLLPGDIPADFVWPVDLNCDGMATYNGRPARWAEREGRLEIFEAGEEKPCAAFGLGLPDDDELSSLGGQLLTHYECDKDDPDDRRFFVDAALLLRDPEGFKIVEPDAPRVAA